MLMVVALGGNALIRRGEPLDADVQRRNIAVAADAIAEIAVGRDVIVTHGTGPLIGLLALQAEAYREVAPYPLDVLGAESEGMIGYLIEQAIANRLTDREVRSLLTRMVGDPDDSAFRARNKSIGPIYDSIEARRLAAKRGWTLARDDPGCRRVVPDQVCRLPSPVASSAVCAAGIRSRNAA